jgi:SAM-dependent methyltransferase
MTGFSADWLALREPFDLAAREATWATLALPSHVARWRERAGPGAHLNVIDLACGSGANLRALAPRLGGPQKWRLVDHDPALLAAVPGAMRQWAQHHGYNITEPPDDHAALRITGKDFSVDLATDRRDLVREIDAVGFAQAHLVTASALLDLVSAEWLAALLRNVRPTNAALLFALSVDGRTTWSPTDEADERVHRLFAEHQRRDKGFGPALGTEAAQHAHRLLTNLGYTILQAQSDWHISGAGAPNMQAAMIEGMAAAAIEQVPHAASAVQQWQTRRLAHAPQSHLTVGHIDFIALPPGQAQPQEPSSG